MHYVVDYITTTIITIHTMLELALLIANLSPKSFVQKDMPNHLSFNDFLYTRKDWHKIAKIVINIFFLQFFTGIHVECLKFHNLDAESQYQCF